MCACDVMLRVAFCDEIAAAAALARESFHAAVAPLFTEEGIRTFLGFASDEAVLKRSRENCLTMIACEGERIVGMMQLREGTHLAMLFVRPGHERKGIGRALVDAAMSRCATPVLTVKSSPNAVGAYVRFGFSPKSAEEVVEGIRVVPMARMMGAGTRHPEATAVERSG